MCHIFFLNENRLKDMKVNSCCCFDLRTGALIIAGFEILSGIFALKTGLIVPLIKFAVGGSLIVGVLKVDRFYLLFAMMLFNLNLFCRTYLDALFPTWLSRSFQ